MKRFDASIPRRMFWSNEIKEGKPCPKCGSALETQYQTYLMAIREHNEMESFLTGNQGGYFCPNCPVVVLDHKVFSQIASETAPFSPAGQFAVLGIVDLEAVPEEKADLPIGADDKPIPLVQFITSDSQRVKERHRPKKRKHRRKR